MTCTLIYCNNVWIEEIMIYEKLRYTIRYKNRPFPFTRTVDSRYTSIVVVLGILLKRVNYCYCVHIIIVSI